MFQGRFGETSARPYVEGRLSIPALGVTTNISFLVDTDADMTSLMPMDAAKAALDYTKLQNASITVGIGGEAKNFEEQAYVIFNNGTELIIFQIQLTIFPPETSIMDVPSLLGRDVIDRCEMIYAPKSGRLSFDPLDYDYSVSV